jgi:pimeloyl-[acyl-carrier protein] methyl ester esterase
MSAEIIAYHGWGYDGSVWEPWRSWTAEQGYLLKIFDRGYFGPTAQPRFSQAATARVLLAHSYGLHLLAQDLLNQTLLHQTGLAADMLIIFSSFQTFHPSSAHSRQRSQQILQHMITQFKTTPQQVLQNFRIKCAHPCEAIDPITDSVPEFFHPDLLLQDLHQLNQSGLDLTILRTIPQILVLQGSLDRIVAPARGKELAQQLAAPYFELDAGHAMPFTHPIACQAALSSFLATGALT